MSVAVSVWESKFLCFIGCYAHIAHSKAKRVLNFEKQRFRNLALPRERNRVINELIKGIRAKKNTQSMIALRQFFTHYLIPPINLTAQLKLGI